MESASTTVESASTAVESASTNPDEPSTQSQQQSVTSTASARRTSTRRRIPTQKAKATQWQNKVMDKIEKKEKKKRKEQEHREQSAFAKYFYTDGCDDFSFLMKGKDLTDAEEQCRQKVYTFFGIKPKTPSSVVLSS